MMPPASKDDIYYVKCPVCGKRVILRDDGKVSAHNKTWVKVDDTVSQALKCTGGGMTPKWLS